MLLSPLSAATRQPGLQQPFLAGVPDIYRTHIFILENLPCFVGRCPPETEDEGARCVLPRAWVNVSSNHAKLTVLPDNKLAFEDRSTNGSYIKRSGKSGFALIKHDQVVLSAGDVVAFANLSTNKPEAERLAYEVGQIPSAVLQNLRPAGVAVRSNHDPEGLPGDVNPAGAFIATSAALDDSIRVCENCQAKVKEVLAAKETIRAGCEELAEAQRQARQEHRDLLKEQEAREVALQEGQELKSAVEKAARVAERLRAELDAEKGRSEEAQAEVAALRYELAALLEAREADQQSAAKDLELARKEAAQARDALDVSLRGRDAAAREAAQRARHEAGVVQGELEHEVASLRLKVEAIESQLPGVLRSVHSRLLGDYVDGVCHEVARRIQSLRTSPCWDTDGSTPTLRSELGGAMAGDSAPAPTATRTLGGMPAMAGMQSQATVCLSDQGRDGRLPATERVLLNAAADPSLSLRHIVADGSQSPAMHASATAGAECAAQAGVRDSAASPLLVRAADGKAGSAKEALAGFKRARAGAGAAGGRDCEGGRGESRGRRPRKWQHSGSSGSACSSVGAAAGAHDGGAVGGAVLAEIGGAAVNVAASPGPREPAPKGTEEIAADGALENVHVAGPVHVAECDASQGPPIASPTNAHGSAQPDLGPVDLASRLAALRHSENVSI